MCRHALTSKHNLLQLKARVTSPNFAYSRSACEGAVVGFVSKSKHSFTFQFVFHKTYWQALGLHGVGQLRADIAHAGAADSHIERWSSFAARGHERVSVRL